MSQYENLKDYFQNKHIKLIQDAVSDYLRNDVQITETVIQSLVCTDDSLEYQEVNNKTGKRKLAWKESATLILISTPSAVGECEDTLVFLKGQKAPLRFPNLRLCRHLQTVSPR